MCTASFSSLVCLVGVVALRSVATGQGCDTSATSSDDSGCDASTAVCDADACDVTVLFAGQVVEPQVRPIARPMSPNCSWRVVPHNHSMTRPQLRIPSTVPRIPPVSQNEELALWMFVEFLKLAPVFMGLGCITMVCAAMISVAQRQKVLDLTVKDATSKIRWTKPITC